MMRIFTGALVAAGLFISAQAIAAQSAEPRDRAGDLSSECKREAAHGYARAYRMEPSLRTVIEDHRTRMSDACGGFLNGSAPTTAALSRCLHEASSGPRHVQRDRSNDREHVARMLDICQRMGSAGK